MEPANANSIAISSPHQSSSNEIYSGSDGGNAQKAEIIFGQILCGFASAFRELLYLYTYTLIIEICNRRRSTRILTRASADHSPLARLACAACGLAAPVGATSEFPSPGRYLKVLPAAVPSPKIGKALRLRSGSVPAGNEACRRFPSYRLTEKRERNEIGKDMSATRKRASDPLWVI